VLVFWGGVVTSWRLTVLGISNYISWSLFSVGALDIAFRWLCTIISNPATLYSIRLCQGWGSSSEKTTWLVFLRIVYLTGIIQGEECIDGVSFARYNPYVQARGRIDQLKRLGHSVDKVSVFFNIVQNCIFFLELMLWLFHALKLYGVWTVPSILKGGQKYGSQALKLVITELCVCRGNMISMSVILDAGGIHSDGRNIHVFTNWLPRLLHPELAWCFVGSHLSWCGWSCTILWAWECEMHWLNHWNVSNSPFHLFSHQYLQWIFLKLLGVRDSYTVEYM